MPKVCEYLGTVGNFTLHWSFPSTTEVQFVFEAPGSSYVGLGLGAAGMKGADMVIGWLNADGSAYVGDYYSTANRKPSLDSSHDLTRAPPLPHTHTPAAPPHNIIR